MCICLRYFIVSIIFSIAVSCSPVSYVEIEVLEPAQVSLPKNMTRVAVMGFNLATNDIKNKTPGEQAFYIDDSLLQDCLSQMQLELSESVRFDTNCIVYYFFAPKDSVYYRGVLDWSFIQYVCKKTNTSGVIALELLAFDNIINYETAYSNQGLNFFGETYKIINVYPYASWRFYDAINYRVIDKYLYSDTLVWNSNDEYFFRQPFPSLEKAFSEAARIAGGDYALRIAPHWARENRTYFVSGNMEMKGLPALVDKNEWNGMATICEKYTESPKSRLAVKAMYNMAFVSEMEGELDIAGEWLKKAFNLATDYRIKQQVRKYLDVIELRIKDQMVLDEQLQD